MVQQSTFCDRDAREKVPPDLAALNQALYDEFLRITGKTSRYDFALWVAGEIRAVAADMVPGDRNLAMARWTALTKIEQNRRLLRHLKEVPPAVWPSLHLAAGGE